MHKPRVFLDSSVIIAALLSSRGGSFYLLTHMHEKVSFVINEYVFAEVRAVLETKFMNQPELSAQFFLTLGLARIVAIPNPNPSDVREAARVISKNDAPILASATISCDYLITLDKELLEAHIVEVANKKHLKICTPRDFLALLR